MDLCGCQPSEVRILNSAIVDIKFTMLSSWHRNRNLDFFLPNLPKLTDIKNIRTITGFLLATDVRDCSKIFSFILCSFLVHGCDAGCLHSRGKSPLVNDFIKITVIGSATSSAIQWNTYGWNSIRIQQIVRLGGTEADNHIVTYKTSVAVSCHFQPTHPARLELSGIPQWSTLICNVCNNLRYSCRPLEDNDEWSDDEVTLRTIVVSVNRWNTLLTSIKDDTVEGTKYYNLATWEMFSF